MMPRARGDMEVGAVGLWTCVAVCSQCVFTVESYPSRIDSIPWFGPETALYVLVAFAGRMVCSPLGMHTVGSSAGCLGRVLCGFLGRDGGRRSGRVL